jgi:hypothetical protein
VKISEDDLSVDQAQELTEVTVSWMAKEKCHSERFIAAEQT